MSAAAPVAVAAVGAAVGGEAAPAVEEQSEFALVLKSVQADKKIKVIKEVRAIKPDLGLKEAKDLVDACPKELMGGLSKEDAEKYKKQLVDVGAEVELK